MNSRLLGLMGISNEASKEIDNKVGGTTVTSVSNLRDVLELVIDGLNDGALACQKLIVERHEPISHVLADGRNQLHPTLV